MRSITNVVVLLFLAYVTRSAIINVEMNPIGGCGPPTYGDSCLIAYLTNLTIGTPPLPVTWVIDAGIDASRNWAYNCTTRGCKSHVLYNPADSSTFKANGTQYSVDYFAGFFRASGTIGADVFSIGNPLTPTPVSQFVMMDTFAPVIYVSMFDFVAGPLGLAYPSPGNEQLQLVNALFLEGLLDAPIISLWAPANNTLVTPGSLTLGGIDTTKYDGELVWVPIVPTPKRGYYFLWMSKLDDFQINGVSTGECQANGCTFFTDPAVGYLDIGKTSPASVSTDCSNLAELPTYTFVIGGVHFLLTPQDYVIQAPNGCFTSLKGGHNDDRPFEFGFPWFKTYYSVFNIATKQAGYAPAM